MKTVQFNLDVITEGEIVDNSIRGMKIVEVSLLIINLLVKINTTKRKDLIEIVKEILVRKKRLGRM